MYSADDMKAAIADYPQAAADALQSIQLGLELGLSAPGLDAAARAAFIDPPSYWLLVLGHHGLVEALAHALAARGVPLDLDPLPLGDTHISEEKASRFANIAPQFRCRIHRAGTVVGSGILVGPSTVVTAWHVINAGPGYAPQNLPADVEVELVDGRRLAAIVLHASPCTPCEFAQQMPANDTVADGHNDIAVLKLEQPVGAGLHFAEIAKPPIPYKSTSNIILLHFPGGEGRGFGEGSTSKIRSLTARVAHSIGTFSGSSGGGCFDTRRMLVGIHQGKHPSHHNRGRFVPIERFVDELNAIVENDIAPPYLWSLDGTPSGRIVIGRDRFAIAYAEAMRGGAARGIHVRRIDAAGDASQLDVSFDILSSIAARDPATRVVRISFEEFESDIAGAIMRRIAEAGLGESEIEARRGVAEGESAPEAVGADRGRRAADKAAEAAAALGVTLWLFIDHPAVAFGDDQRAALEGFIDRALRRTELRLVVAGYEAAAIPGEKFDAMPPPGAILPGLMTEFLGTFRRTHVEQALSHAAKDAGYDLGLPHRDAIVDEALDGIAEVNGYYSIAASGEVGQRLAARIKPFFKTAKVAHG